MASFLQSVQRVALNYGLIEKRHTTPNSVSTSDSFSDWSNFFGISNSISTEQALRFSAVYASINIIAETLATLPIAIYRKNGEALERIAPNEHSVAYLLQSRPNEFQTWFDFMHGWITNTLGHGNGYALVERDRYANVKGLRYLKHGDCAPYYQMFGYNPYLYYYVFGEAKQRYEVLHLKCLGSDGVIGKSPIELASGTINLSIDAQKGMNKFYRAGMKSKPAFELATTLEKDAFVRLRQQLTDSMNDERVLLLEDGLTAKPFSITPRDAETIAMMNYTVEDIGRIYRVPLHKLQSLSRSTNNNIEQQSIDFVVDTVMPWVERIEQELKFKLFDTDESDIVVKMDVDYLLRGESGKRAIYYTSLFQTGAISPDEIRIKEGMNPIRDNYMTKYYLNGTYRAIDAPAADVAAPNQKQNNENDKSDK